MINSKEFQKQFKKLLMSRVEGMDWEDKLSTVRLYLRDLEGRASPEDESTEMIPSLEIIPFEPGRRPFDEALYPGHGCSEHVGYLSTNAEDPAEAGDEVWILFRAHNLYAFMAPFNRDLEVRMSAWFLPPIEGSGEPCPVPGLTDIVVPPRIVSTASYPVPMLDEGAWSNFQRSYYIAVLPTNQLLPRRTSGAARVTGTWDWSQVNESLHQRTPDGNDPFTFCNLFRQKLRIDLKLVTEGRTLTTRSTEVEVFDTGRFGSLYARLSERLIRADTEAQARQKGVEELYYGYHPWFPVLTIGSDKAMLYLRATHQDLEHQRRNLPDPLWLLRVGLYLELLTCIGIFEAVKADYPDLLSPEEREVFENSEAFAPIRARLDVGAWKKVWDLREITLRSAGFFSAGPVSLTNLLRKQKATLAFLHAHHEDLKNAIELAGANLVNAQETWHRVFRDAERAVLKDSVLAFPELNYLDPGHRDFVLQHQHGDFRLFGRYSLSIPDALTGLFGDQDGIFPSACRQYRDSMNEVAHWATSRGLMDYTGDECIPKNASLLEAYMDGNMSLVAALQRRDGYGPTLDLEEPSFSVNVATSEDVAALLSKTQVFRTLTEREVRKLATQARRAVYGPLDRVVVQGQKDSSLFVVASGSVEVLVRQPDGRDLLIATLEQGAVFGEFALLTGAERTATVRAVHEVVLYEISKKAIQSIIEARPQLVIELSLLMAGRQTDLRDLSERHLQEQEERVQSLAGRIRRFILG